MYVSAVEFGLGLSSQPASELSKEELTLPHLPLIIDFHHNKLATDKTKKCSDKFYILYSGKTIHRLVKYGASQVVEHS